MQAGIIMPKVSWISLYKQEQNQDKSFQILSPREHFEGNSRRDWTVCCRFKVYLQISFPQLQVVTSTRFLEGWHTLWCSLRHCLNKFFDLSSKFGWGDITHLMSWVRKTSFVCCSASFTAWKSLMQKPTCSCLAALLLKWVSVQCYLLLLRAAAIT